MRRFPFYVTQQQLDAPARLLCTHQTVINTVSSDGPTSDELSRFLTALRVQCCDRSDAADPFSELPRVPDSFDVTESKRGRQ